MVSEFESLPKNSLPNPRTLVLGRGYLGPLEIFAPPGQILVKYYVPAGGEQMPGSNYSYTVIYERLNCKKKYLGRF